MRKKSLHNPNKHPKEQCQSLTHNSWFSVEQLLQNLQNSSKIPLRIAWLLPWLMNLMRPELWRVAWADITPPSALSLAMKVNAPLRPVFLHKLLLAELLSSRANLNCDRLRQTSLEYSQPGKSRHQIRNGEQQWERKHTCVIFSYFELFGILFDKKIIKIFMMKKFL